jgi:hypothetical protein
MSYTVNILNIVTSGTNHTLTVDDVFYLQPGFTITIGTNDYVIKSVNATTNVIVLTGATIVGTSFLVNDVFYFHGTPIQTSSEIDTIKNAADKTPMIYFLENFSETFYNEDDNILERESSVRLFFLSQMSDKWGTETTYDNCIEPMRKLLELFIDKLNTSSAFNMDGKTFEVINHFKFGVYINNKGYEKQLFADKLSGCELQITLSIYKTDEC